MKHALKFTRLLLYDCSSNKMTHVTYMKKDTTLMSYILHVIFSFYYPDYVHEPTSVGGWSIVTFNISETLSSMLQRKFG